MLRPYRNVPRKSRFLINSFDSFPGTPLIEKKKLHRLRNGKEDFFRAFFLRQQINATTPESAPHDALIEASQKQKDTIPAAQG